MQTNAPQVRFSFKVVAPDDDTSIIDHRVAVAIMVSQEFSGQVVNTHNNYGKGGAALEAITMNVLVPESKSIEAREALSTMNGVLDFETPA